MGTDIICVDGMKIPIGTLCIIIKARPHLMGLHCEVTGQCEDGRADYIVYIPANPAPNGKRWGAWGNQIMPIDPDALDMEGNEFKPNATDHLHRLEETMKRVLSE